MLFKGTNRHSSGRISRRTVFFRYRTRKQIGAFQRADLHSFPIFHRTLMIIDGVTRMAGLRTFHVNLCCCRSIRADS
jgi:hypothetical protein